LLSGVCTPTTQLALLNSIAIQAAGRGIITCGRRGVSQTGFHRSLLCWLVVG